MARPHSWSIILGGKAVAYVCPKCNLTVGQCPACCHPFGFPPRDCIWWPDKLKNAHMRAESVAVGIAFEIIQEVVSDAGTIRERLVESDQALSYVVEAAGLRPSGRRGAEVWYPAAPSE